MQSFALSCIKLGIIPQHIAFIMDGNRRYAKINSIETSMGHAAGFHQLENVTTILLKNSDFTSMFKVGGQSSFCVCIQYREFQ